jgi:hypothetical protein
MFSSTPWPMLSGSFVRLAGGVARGGRADIPMGEATLMDKFIGKTEKVRSSLSGDVTALTSLNCRLSEKLLGMRKGMKLESFVRRVGRRQSQARPARRMTKGLELLL